MVLPASQNPLSTTNPVGTKLERRSDCRMALIPPEKALRESQTASNLSQSQICKPIDTHIPRYSCSRAWMDNGGPLCIAFGGLRVDDAIEEALLGVVGPGAIAAATAAAKEAGERQDQVRDALSRDLEAARYAADRAFRQYDAADPANRLVASELESRWNRALAHAAEVEGKIATHHAARPMPPADPASLGVLASNLKTA